jgi:hypothetical protein
MNTSRLQDLFREPSVVQFDLADLDSGSTACSI